jgi:hypothetical protein
MRTHLTIFLLLGACAAPGSSVPLDGDFELRPGETITVAGTGQTVTFEAVTEDSRCPIGVMCVWAGNARVKIRLGVAGQDSSVTLNTQLEPRWIAIGKLRLELKSVTPHPQAGASIAPDAYRVTLRATGA